MSLPPYVPCSRITAICPIEKSVCPPFERCFLLVSDMLSTSQHLADSAWINPITGCNMVLEFPRPVSQPYIHSIIT